MQINASIIMGFECLQVLVTVGRPVGCKELAQLMSTNETKANRTLQTLKKIGMVSQNKQKLYYPGQGVQILATQALYSSDILKKTLSVLNTTPPKNFAVAVGLLWHNTVSYLYFREPNRSFFESISSRPLLSLEYSSIGILLLAFQAPRERAKILKQLNIPKDAFNWEEIRKNKNFVYYIESKKEFSIAVPIGKNPFVAIAYAQFYDPLTKEEILYYIDDLTQIANEISSM